MILQGNQRGGGQNLATHLLKEENDHIEVHELRGFVANDLGSALGEARAIARGTRARQYLFSLSLNPPSKADVSTEDFKEAIGKAENRLGLGGQPRAIVFHEKAGRRHCHVVWSRINAREMKAIPLPYTKLSLQEVSRELYIKHGWPMPKGFMCSEERDPRNFTMAQWQQARRTGKDPRAIKAALQDCWAVSDSLPAFEHALTSRGYTLARGNRRSFVAIDHVCEVYAIPKWTGVKTKDVNARLGDPAKLKSVDEVKAEIAEQMQQTITALRNEQKTVIATRMAELAARRKTMIEVQKKERALLRQVQVRRAQKEMEARRDRYRKGIRGLLDRVTGRYKKITQRNEQALWQSQLRDQRQRDELVFKHVNQVQSLQQRMMRLRSFDGASANAHGRDYRQYVDIKSNVREQFEKPGGLRNERGPDGTIYEL